MIGGKGAKRSAEYGVGPGCVDFDTIIAIFKVEIHTSALRPPDPFFLHQAHPVWPPLKRFQVLQ